MFQPIIKHRNEKKAWKKKQIKKKYSIFFLFHFVLQNRHFDDVAAKLAFMTFFAHIFNRYYEFMMDAKTHFLRTKQGKGEAALGAEKMSEKKEAKFKGRFSLGIKKRLNIFVFIFFCNLPILHDFLFRHESFSRFA